MILRRFFLPPAQRRGLLRLFLVLALLLGGGLSCSRVKFAYNWADWYLEYKIDHYFDLSGALKNHVESEIEHLLAWHREAILPSYADFLGLKAKEIQKGLDLKWTVRLRLEGMNLVRETLKPLLPNFVDFFTRLSPEQIDYFENRLTEENLKLEKRYGGSEEEKRKHRAERIEEYLEDWVGELLPAQVQFLKDKTQELPVGAGTWLKKRKERQKTFLDLLRNKSDAEISDKLLHFLDKEVVNWDQSSDKTYMQGLKQFRHSYDVMVAGVLSTLNPQQKNRLLKKVLGLEKDFRELHAAGRKKP